MIQHWIHSRCRVWDFALDDSDMAKMSDLNVGWRHLIWAETSAHAVRFQGLQSLEKRI